MKTDRRHYVAATIAVVLIGIVLWTTTLGKDPAAPTAAVPAGANPQTETPPELPGGAQNANSRVPSGLAR